MRGELTIPLCPDEAHLSVGDLDVGVQDVVDGPQALVALAAGAGDRTIRELTAAGAALGLAFQIADDVLDATASSERLGKTAGSDAAMSKSTYVALLGVDAAQHKSTALVADAMGHFERAGVSSPTLDRLAHFVSARQS